MTLAVVELMVRVIDPMLQEVFTGYMTQFDQCRHFLVVSYSPWCAIK